jgi:hypothetical protein
MDGMDEVDFRLIAAPQNSLFFFFRLLLLLLLLLLSRLLCLSIISLVKTV